MCKTELRQNITIGLMLLVSSDINKLRKCALN